MLKTQLQSNTSGELACYRTGRGPAMMLIHGVGMNANYWNNITTELAQYFSLTVIDLPGHGNSKSIDIHNPSLTDYTNTIASFIDNRCIVVGHSMGAMIALDIATRHKEKATGIAVLNGIYRRNQAATQSIHNRAAELNQGKKTDASATLARWFGNSPVGTDALAADHCRQWLDDVDPAGYANAYRAFAHGDAPADDLLSSIQCPALFMTGELEPNSTPSMSKQMSALVSNSSYQIIANAKHMMSLTHGDATSHGIIEFFKRA